MRAVAPDLARLPELLAAQGGELGRTLHILASTTSTNDEARRGAKDGAPHGTVWVAEKQTVGRGRQGRTWVSFPGESLLFSVLVRLDLAASKIPRVALVSGLAVRDAVARAAPAADVRIKWPNDVLVAGRKVAGVLVEAVSSGARTSGPHPIVVGIGINVHARMFPPDLGGRATSIALAAAAPPDRAAVLADVLASLDRDLRVVGGRGLGLVRARIQAADALKGEPVRSDDGGEGIACGIDDDGRLLVRIPGGTLVRWVSGEVHLVRARDP